MALPRAAAPYAIDGETLFALPAPTAEAVAHSAALAAHIRDEIGNEAISFARYMELALYAPGLGYYSAGACKFGQAGDFVTAPELSPLFARCLARQCAEVLHGLGSGDILEFGAGSGKMAADVLLALQDMDCPPRHYFIVEVSAELRARQRQALQRAGALAERVRWLDCLPNQPIRGVILANEVLDAMPVQRFRVHEAGVDELCVGCADDRFIERRRPADAPLSDAVTRLQQQLGAAFAPGFTSEIRTGIGAWVRALGDVLSAGAALIIDYGGAQAACYHPQRHQGSLLCHYRHRAHGDPFIHVGLQDITAEVDFSALADAGTAAGFDLAGYTTQAHFLLATGLLQALDDQCLSAQTRLRYGQQIKWLTLPDEMGERFKVLAFSRAVEAPLAGFSYKDLRDRL